MPTQDDGDLLFEEAGIRVYFGKEKQVYTARDGDSVVATFSSIWTQEQLRSICKIVRKNMIRSFEVGMAEGEMRTVNRFREALLLDPLTGWPS